MPCRQLVICVPFRRGVHRASVCHILRSITINLSLFGASLPTWHLRGGGGTSNPVLENILSCRQMHRTRRQPSGLPPSFTSKMGCIIGKTSKRYSKRSPTSSQVMVERDVARAGVAQCYVRHTSFCCQLLSTAELRTESIPPVPRNK